MALIDMNLGDKFFLERQINSLFLKKIGKTQKKAVLKTRTAFFVCNLNLVK